MRSNYPMMSDKSTLLYGRGKDPYTLDIEYVNSAAAATWGEISAPNTATPSSETGIVAVSATGLDVGVFNYLCISGGEYAVKQGTLVGTGDVALGNSIPIHAWMDSTPASGSITFADGGSTYLTITGGAVDSNGGRIPIPADYNVELDSWEMDQIAMATVATDIQTQWLDIRNYETGGAVGDEDYEYGIINATNGYNPISIKDLDYTIHNNSETIIPKSRYINATAETKSKIRFNIWK